MTTAAVTAYEARKARLRAQYAGMPRGQPVRLAKQTSNLFRTRQRPTAQGLDVRDFDGVLSVDTAGRIADVQGMTTYEQLVDATLAHGLMPLVVPQFKTVTLGGAVTGLGIESASFRNGLAHESVLELELLVGDGRTVVARPDNEHGDLFGAFPNSYGTLGYALRLKIELEPVLQYVRLRHLRFGDRGRFFEAMAEICERRAHDGERVDFVDGSDGERVDFVDGTVFARDEMYLTLGMFVDGVPRTSDYTGMGVYYRSLQRLEVDHLSVRDYLWRWDTDWFWCSRNFGVQDPRIRRCVPKRWLRSDNYWRLWELERRYGPIRKLERLRGRPAQEHVVQDVEVPIARAAEFFDFLVREIPISPFWVCPMRPRDRRRWALCPLDPDATYVNFGFWSALPLADGQPEGTHNRRVEQVVEELGGRKSLYSDSYYDPDEFWRLHDGRAYGQLRRAYDSEGRLADLYRKCVERA